MSENEAALRGDLRPSRTTAVAWQTIDGETVLLRLREKELVGLNPVGRRTWEMADGTRTIDEIAAVVADEYEITAGTARRDVMRFIRELVGLGALELKAG